jgi:hypothetical protein
MSASAPIPVLLATLKDILSSNASLSAGIQNLEANPDSALVVEAILLLCAGAPCPPWVAPQPLPDEWNTARTRLLSAFESLAPNEVTSLKRPRGSDLTEPSTTTAKKPKLIDDSDDPPIFTLHGISFTSPIRKKADITVRRVTLRFTDPKDPTSNLYEPIPIRKFRRGFIVSTPGKAKPHWTTIILPEDPNDQSVIFGCDAAVTTPQSTTKYPSPPQSHAKGTPTKPLIHSLFAYFPSGPDGLVDLYEPKSADFRSALGNGQSIDAYIGAKDGHLHFFGNGVLWGEKKPCLWFPLEDIVDMHTGVSSGRSLTLYVSIKPKSQVSGANLAGEMEGVDDAPLEMHDFSLIDSKEETPIKKWITDHKQQFAAQHSSNTTPHGVEATSIKEQNKASGKTTIVRSTGPVKLVDAVFDDSDSEDQDFASHSDSDSSNDPSASGTDDEREEENGDDGGEDDSDAEDVEGLGPAQGTAGRAGGSLVEEDVDELDKGYQRVPIPAGVKVSAAALVEARNMVGEAFGIGR